MLKTILWNGAETEYLVSSTGYIYSKKRNIKLRPSLNHKGYELVVLYIDGKPKSVAIHRLVASHFVPNPDSKSVVNHIDGNKRNNDYTNLEWVTPKENTHHAWSTGLCKALRGADNGSAIYTEKQIHSVCQLLENHIPLNIIAENTGVGKYTVSNILHKNAWFPISRQYEIDKKYYRRAYFNSDMTSTNVKKAKNIIKSGVIDIRRICELLNIEYEPINIKPIEKLIKKTLKEGSTTSEKSGKLVIKINLPD